jgi:hypothetical protein
MSHLEQIWIAGERPEGFSGVALHNIRNVCPQCLQTGSDLGIPAIDAILEVLPEPFDRIQLGTVGRKGHLALDGLQPDVGHEVLWVLRDWLSCEVLRARRMLSAPQEDVADLLREVKRGLAVPIVGVISDGQPSLRCAVEQALPDVPHQLCHLHSLREAAKPVSEADRHAKKARQKRLRGVRPIERQVEKRTDPEAAVIRGSCSAVRSALTDEGQPPLAASGLTRHDRLSALSQRLERGAKRGACPTRCSGCRRSSNGAGLRPRPCGPRGVLPIAGSIVPPPSSAPRHTTRRRRSRVAEAACWAP